MIRLGGLAGTADPARMDPGWRASRGGNATAVSPSAAADAADELAAKGVAAVENLRAAHAAQRTSQVCRCDGTERLLAVRRRHRRRRHS